MSGGPPEPRPRADPEAPSVSGRVRAPSRRMPGWNDQRAPELCLRRGRGWPGLATWDCHRIAPALSRGSAQILQSANYREHLYVMTEPATANATDRPHPVRHGGQELEEHIRALRRYARALIGNSMDADDLVQETLKRALTYLSDRKEIRNLRAYLLTMLHHVRIDHAKREAWARDQVPLDDITTPGIPATQLARLECRELGRAIQALPDGQREVLLLVCLEGLSYQETAELMDIPIGTVMSRLNRARAALKQTLMPEPVADNKRTAATPVGAVRPAA